MKISILVLSLLLNWKADAQDAAVKHLLFPQTHDLQNFLQDPSLLSNSGRPLRLIRFESPQSASMEKPFRFLIQAGLHGNETLTSTFVIWLVRRFQNGQSALNTLPAHEISIDFLPFANPDGAADLSRYNAKGVNLNRNFGVLWGLTRENPGSASFSEPETRAIQRLFEKRNYTAAVDVHGYINWIVAPSDPSTLQARRSNFVPTAAQATRYAAWKTAIIGEMTHLGRYELKTAGELGDGGAFEDWAFWKMGTLAFCLELSSIQRFVQASSASTQSNTMAEADARIDLFKNYELFITRMFHQAIAIKRAENRPPPRLASDP